MQYSKLIRPKWRRQLYCE